jgi:hypothetical protein
MNLKQEMLYESILACFLELGLDKGVFASCLSWKNKFLHMQTDASLNLFFLGKTHVNTFDFPELFKNLLQSSLCQIHRFVPYREFQQTINVNGMLANQQIGET